VPFLTSGAFSLLGNRPWPRSRAGAPPGSRRGS